jgi:hypothetical protein
MRKMEIDNKVKAIAFAILLFGIILFTIPPTKDDPDKPKLINIETKQEVFQQKINESFVVATFMCVLVPFLILQFLEDSGKVSKRRSLLEVYKDIPDEEKIKFQMPDIQSKQLNDILVQPYGENLSLLRYPASARGVYYNILLDFRDDWKTRNTTTPIYSIWTEAVGIDRAKSILNEKKEPLGKALQTLKGVLSPEEVKRNILLKTSETEEQRRMEGDSE